MLSLIDIAQRYGKRDILLGMNHNFGPGTTVISGPSGTGKSTLLRLCATVEKPSAGRIEWNGVPLSKQRRAFRQTLGYAPQRIDFPEDISGMDFLLHVAALKNLGLGPAREQASILLSRLGLARDASGRIATYSGGMRRRLGLAQAFLGTPSLLVLDEPTAELDPVTAGHVHDLIFEQAESVTVLMTTHLEEGLSKRDHQRLTIQPAP